MTLKIQLFLLYLIFSTFVDLLTRQRSKIKSKKKCYLIELPHEGYKNIYFSFILLLIFIKIVVVTVDINCIITVIISIFIVILFLSLFIFLLLILFLF